MLKVIVKKLMRLLLTLVALSVIAFATIVAADELNIFHAWSVIGEVDWTVVASLKARYGLAEPVHVQYFLWVQHWMQGDWGHSLLWNQPVGEVLLMALGRTLTIYVPLVLLFCGAVFVLWVCLGPQTRISRGFVLSSAYLCAIPMFLWALVLFGVAKMLFDFDPYRLSTFVNEGPVWDFPRILDMFSRLAVPTLILGTAILGEFFVARQRWFERAHDDLETFRAKKLCGKNARQAWLRLILPQFVCALRDFLPRLVSEMVLLLAVTSWPPTLSVILAHSLSGGDPRLSGAILFVITGGVAVGCFLLDVWAVWLERIAKRLQLPQNITA